MSETPTEELLTAFSGQQLLGSYSKDKLIALLRAREPEQCLVLVFENTSGKQIDLDLRFSAASSETAQPEFHAAVTTRGRGRPKLGVKGREVTLLPRHWQWLEQQSGGASATLRRLVEQARKVGADDEKRRSAQSRCNRVLTALAGDLKHYEDATRALFAGDDQAFQGCIKTWPVDIRCFVVQMAEGAFV